MTPLRPSPRSLPATAGPHAEPASTAGGTARGSVVVRRPDLAVALPHLRLGAGIFCSALVLAVVGAAAGTPLLIAPLLATAALKHAAPHDPGVAPRRVLLAHLVGATTGVTAGALLGVGSVAIALATAAAAVLMLTLDVAHAPGVATAYVAVQQHANHWFPLQVALAGAAVLVATTVVLTPLLHGHRYPLRARVPGAGAEREAARGAGRRA